MPFGLEKKIGDAASFFSSDLPPSDEPGEISKVSDMLVPGEQVIVVARQSRIKSGGSMITPAVIFATNKRLIIREPAMFGLTETIHDISYDTITDVTLQRGLLFSSIIISSPSISGTYGVLSYMKYKRAGRPGEIEALPKEKAEEILKCMKQGIEEARNLASQKNQEEASSYGSSFENELEKITKLRHDEVINDLELIQMRQKLISAQPNPLREGMPNTKKCELCGRIVEIRTNPAATGMPFGIGGVACDAFTDMHGRIVKYEPHLCFDAEKMNPENLMKIMYSRFMNFGGTAPAEEK